MAQKPPLNSTGTSQFFMQQNMSPATKNVTESPVMSSPQTKQAPTPEGVAKGRKKLIILAVIVAILLAGGGAGFFLLSNQTSDVGQETPEEKVSARLTLKPGSSTFTQNTKQDVLVELTVEGGQKAITAFELVMDLTGNVPADIVFRPNIIEGFTGNPSSPTITSTGQQLKVIFSSQDSEGNVPTQALTELGTLSFTATDSGQLNLRFNPSLSKVEIAGTNEDILRPPNLIVYKFEPSAAAVVEASESAIIASAEQIIVSSPTPTIVPGIPAAGGSGGSVATTSATPTKTSTPTPTRASTVAPTATKVATSSATATTAVASSSSSRETSQPAQTQEAPVSGNGFYTLLLVFGGILFITTGTFLWNQETLIEDEAL